MSRRAWAYIWSVFLVGGLLSGLSIAAGPVVAAADHLIFVALVALTICAQFIEATAPSRQSYYLHLVFHFAGVLLLPPLLFALLIAIPHLAEWIRKRLTNSKLLRDWYIQPFNICSHLIAGFSARLVFEMLAADHALLTSPVAVLAGAIVYVAINHMLVGIALFLARGIRLRDSGVLDLSNLIGDLVQLCLGYVVAVLWQLNPVLLVPALSPLAMIYRALMVPQLQQDAQTDPKTGLSNARHFNEKFSAELERARRFNRPLAVLMADLDLLRNINNRYGHQAGDAVLIGVGRILREAIREYDLAARFGGEEFCIVLLEADETGARSVAERLRRAIEAAEFEVATSVAPIRATMSFGVACYPADGVTTEELIRQADIATYQAKLSGRNCVVSSRDVPHSLSLENTSPAGEQAATYAAAFIGHAASPSTVDPSASGAPPASNTSASPGVLPAPTPHPNTAPLLSWFVGAVIVAGLAVTLASCVIQPVADMTAVAALVILAVIAEVLQVKVYEENTVSVSVALAFAAALVAGISGVAAVSAGIALTHYYKVRPPLYRTAFNWATHILAGSAPALVFRVTAIRLDIANVPLLGVLTLIVGLAYYAVDTGLIATAMSLSRREAFASTWRRQFRWLSSHYVVLCVIGLFVALAYRALGLAGMVVFALPAFMLRYAQKQYVDRTMHSVRELRRMNQELTRANREIVDASRSIRQLNDELFLTLGKIIDARDVYASGHAAQVAKFATAIAAELGLPLESVERIRQAALLHDIGKLGIPEHILHKPGKLTDDEYAWVQTHATLGAEFLETCQGLRHLAPFIQYHHERWDGRGYPNQLRREQIPLEARILSVCDAVEAMASDRPYHRAMTLGAIIAELRQCSGTQFDPAVVEAFVRVVERNGSEFVSNSAAVVNRAQPDQVSRLRINLGHLAVQPISEESRSVV